MNKLQIITAMTFTQLEQRVNEIGETFKILSVSLSEADHGRLKVAAVLLEENIEVVTINVEGGKLWVNETDTIKNDVL